MSIQSQINRDITWDAVWIGYLVAMLGTLMLGGGLFWLYQNVWWLAFTGLGMLFVGGWVAGWRARTAEPLNGAFIAVLYFSATVVALFGGELTGWLPDPLPGLPRGDSTFFFIWPLGQLVASTLGAVLGGWVSAEARR